MYAETDFLLALIKEEDWLSEPAEKSTKRTKTSYGHRSTLSSN